MKKSLMAAALVALSSTAFADKDSFVVGLSGQYFKPLGEGKCEMNRPHFPTDTVEDANKSKQFFISPYVGYNINEMFRVGLTVMWNPIGYQFKHEKKSLAGDQNKLGTLCTDVATLAAAATDPTLSHSDNAALLARVLEYKADLTQAHLNAPDHVTFLAAWPRYKTDTLAITNSAYQELYNELDKTFIAGSTAPQLNITDCYKPLPILVTGDTKLFENSTLSVSAGLGLGMTRWSHEYKLTSSADDKEFRDPGKYETASAWTAAGKVEVAAHFNLADVATLSVSGGYLHLGAPDKFEHGDDDKDKNKSNKKETKVSKEFPSGGLLLSVGVSKEF